MLKKILTLSLVAVLLSVTAFAELTPVLADAGLPASIAVSLNDAVIDETTGLGGTVTLAVTSDAVYENAIVVTAVFDGNTFLTASITDAALELGENEEIITLPEALSDTNDSYNVKFYLWESKTTLEPLAQPVEEAVTPQEEKPEVWSGNASETPLTPNSDGYYEISNGEELAWFANYVNAGNNTVNAILTEDIYLNDFFEADGTFDEDWYDTKTGATSWGNITTGYMIKSYKGTFDGAGHTIYGLYMANGDNEPAGFFNTISAGGVLKNVNFKGAYVVAADETNNRANSYISVVCARAAGEINNVTADGKIGIAEGGYVNFIGSIVAQTLSTKATIKDCTSDVDIDLHGMSTALHGDAGKADTRGLGGIVGSNAIRDTVIENCVNNGEIYAPYYQKIGGILGNATQNTTVKNCTNNATITHAATVGTYSGCDQIVGCVTSGKTLTASGNAENGTLVPFTAE